MENARTENSADGAPDLLLINLRTIGTHHCDQTVGEEAAQEIERLRAEVERFRTDGASAVRWAPGSAYWSDVLRELFGPDARKGIDVLEARWRAELERANTAETLLRQALEALERAHQTAMEQTLRARVPECAEFAGIAQDLDFVVAALRERLGEKA